MKGWTDVTAVLRRRKRLPESDSRPASAAPHRTAKKVSTKKDIWTDEIADRAHFKGWSDDEIVRLRELCAQLPEDVRKFSLIYRWVMGGLRIGQIEQLLAEQAPAVPQVSPGA